MIIQTDICSLLVKFSRSSILPVMQSLGLVFSRFPLCTVTEVGHNFASQNRGLQSELVACNPNSWPGVTSAATKRPIARNSLLTGLSF
ncbi:hypothetical protein I7I48_12179 [Histoplasma ohiense]|nr:hypothetical protein I7I48_12179 [Histoplasma ohiense (nom. inval.)]